MLFVNIYAKPHLPANLASEERPELSRSNIKRLQHLGLSLYHVEHYDEKYHFISALVQGLC